MGGLEERGLRWRRWTVGSPKNLHQPGQTTNLLVHILRPPICKIPTQQRRDFANSHQAKKEHQKYLESLPSTSYPLAPTSDPAQVQMPDTPSQKGEIQGHYPLLRGEHEAESVDKQPFQQR